MGGRKPKPEPPVPIEPSGPTAVGNFSSTNFTSANFILD